MNDYSSRRERAVARGVATAFGVEIVLAENAELRARDGTRFIDFCSGIGVANVGHRNPGVVEAVKAQMGRSAHLAIQVVGYPGYVEVAERLNELSPCRPPTRAALFSTGAEAVENAVKLARAATGRTDIVAFNDAFHGRSFMALSLTGKASPYKDKMGPLVPGVHHLAFPGPGPAAADQCAAAFETLFQTRVAPADVAAVIIEPVQGEGGFNVASFAALRVIRRICDQHGIVLIADEIQSGFGRTGRMFAIEHAGVQPDVITLAKGLGGGLPLSAVVGHESVMNAIAPGGLGGTFAANPLSCAAALAVMQAFRREELLERAREIGATIRNYLDALLREFPGAFDVRGLGAMIAADFDTASPRAAADLTASRVKAEAFDRGLLILACGRRGNALRFLPPLTIGSDLLVEGMTIFCEAVAALSRAARGAT